MQAMNSTGMSWRDMYVSQPPAKRLLYLWEFQTNVEPGQAFRVPGVVSKDGQIEDSHGVTAGQIADNIRELQDETSGQLVVVEGITILSSFVSFQEEKEQLHEQHDTFNDGADIVRQEGGE